MPKHKPHKGLLKRVTITKGGRVKARIANGSHLRSGKTAGRLRDMRKARLITNKGLRKRMTKLLGRRIKSGREERHDIAATTGEKE